MTQRKKTTQPQNSEEPKKTRKEIERKIITR